MKKLLTFVLAMLLLVGLSVPAMAFTSDAEADDDSVPYDLKIYLVEYDDNDFFGIASLPKSDRGYAKNEIVAAVVELYVPEDETIAPPDNLFLILSGENVDFDVTDNYVGGVLSFATSFTNGPDTFASPPIWNIADPTDHDKIYIQTAQLPGEETYRWLIFAKVTDDDASITARLLDGMTYEMDFSQAPGIVTTLDGVIYSIGKTPPINAAGDFQYVIYVSTGDYAGDYIIIDVDEDNVSLGMSIYIPAGAPYNYDNPGTYPLGVNTAKELGIVKGAVVDTSGDDFDDVMDIYNDVVVDAFGMDYMLIGNYVRDSYFEKLVSPKTLIATVDIAPWTAYVTVPDNIVVDPPKTGDAASIMGFVMVAVSCAGAIALKKRG